MYAYGCCENACELMKSYLLHRQQRVKLSNSRSEWDHLRKGVPQGSIMGPLLYNIFIQDLFYYIGENLYNFADDNSISKTHSNIFTLTK